MLIFVYIILYLSLISMYSPMLSFEESKVRRFHGVAHEIEIRIIPLYSSSIALL